MFVMMKKDLERHSSRSDLNRWTREVSEIQRSVSVGRHHLLLATQSLFQCKAIVLSPPLCPSTVPHLT